METSSWRSNSYLSKYDCGAMQDYTTVPNHPLADEKGMTEEVSWERFGNNVLIIGICGATSTILHIPNAINGYPVKGIRERAFMNCSFSDVYIPDSVEYIGALAIGFFSYSIYSDDEEKKVKSQNPFAHNWPTSTLMDFTYYLHQSPKTKIHGIKSSVAEEYANKHQLLFVSI